MLVVRNISERYGDPVTFVMADISDFETVCRSVWDCAPKLARTGNFFIDIDTNEKILEILDEFDTGGGSA